MTPEELFFFNDMPAALPFYEALAQKLRVLPGVTVKVQKSQITFRARYGFAFVSLRRIKGCPEVFILVTFGLDHRLDSPRIALAVEPYPNRWTHHLIVTDEAQIDAELMGWLRAAYAFAQSK